MTISNNSDLEFLQNSPNRGTVTGFNEWVWAKHDEKMQMRLFYSMHPELKLPRDEFSISEHMVKSKMAHAKLKHQQLQFGMHYLNGFSGEENKPSNWTPIYIDKHNENPDVLDSPRLLLDGKPLRGCPDLVLKNKVSKQILVIENKITNVPLRLISEEGYPNVRAQLWAYSWMSPWADLEDHDVLMGATFWDLELDESIRTKTWKRSDFLLNRDCREWYCDYGGEFKFPNKSD